MAVKKKIKFIQVLVRLGSVPRFELHASEKVRIEPAKAEYHASGVSTQNQQVLKDVLSKLLADYPASEIELCIDETAVPKAVVASSNCP